ncbi:hypothetical protein GCM10009539_36970 [Cryptosporangium japonicum]|uniref:Uncharacterized protein n=1 Tax=Cryptosporangium japonicum TaxID=80872 RepID=A0ABN0UEZ6_9ACTN
MVSNPQDPQRLGMKYWITRYVGFGVVIPALILAFFAVTHWLFGRGDTWHPGLWQPWWQGFLGQGLGAATALLIYDVVRAVRRHRRRDSSIPAAGE